jgi:hypothetical protein
VVDVDRGVDQMSVVPVALGHRFRAPLVESLAWRSPAPGRSSRLGSCGSGRRRVHGPAGTSFWEGVASEVGRRPRQDLVLLLELFGPPPQLAVLGLQAEAGVESVRLAIPPASSRSAICSQRLRHD